MLLKRNWTGAGTNKARDTRGIPHNVPGFIAHNHLHQYIAREDFTLHCTPLTLLNLYLLFHWNHDAEDFVAHVHGTNPRFEVTFSFVFIARLRVDRLLRRFTRPRL